MSQILETASDKSKEINAQAANQFDLLDHSNITDEELISIMNESFESSNIDKVKRIIEAEVIEYDKIKGIVHVEAGTKYEGRIDEKEFYLDGELDSIEKGKKIEVYIEDLDEGQTKMKISREKAIRERSWEKIVAAFENDEPVDCVPFAPLKSGNGFVIDIQGVIAFLPKSQSSFGMDFMSGVSVEEALIGNKVQAKIIHCDKKTRNVVVSIKRVFEDSQRGARDEMLSGIKEGDTIEGRIKNITPYGSFINIGGYIDGLLHINDISWSKISHPAEVLRIGEKIKVKVLKMTKIDKDIKISLGLKQLEDNPWSNFSEKYKVGSVVSGKITNIANYGIFVGIDDGVEGLVHVSEISWKNDGARRIKEEYKVGQEIQTKILEINIDKHRISLGVKQLEDNPWDNFISKNETGKIIKGTVANITDFGIFVSLNERIDGLVSMSDVAYGGVERYIPESMKVGSPIDVLYIEGDAKSQRIRLGIKQLYEKTISQKESLLTKNTILDCSILEVKHDGTVVSVLDGAMTCFISESEIGKDLMTTMSIGQKIKAAVVNYNQEYKRLHLSVLKVFELDAANSSSSKLGDSMK